MKQFDKKFMIGAATAAHQVEGNNKNSDFWVMEQIPGSSYKEPSLDAADHYHRYKEDIDLLAAAGLNAYRFSIEWARIEPEKGIFDLIEIEHYRDVLNYCHKKSVTPIVTLHHFSSPKWLISKGGWESESTVSDFEEYCRFVVLELGSLMPYICTINEANMGIQIARLMADFMKMMSIKATENQASTDVQVGLNLKQEDPMQAYNKGVEEAFGIPYNKVQPFLGPRTKAGDRIIMDCHVKARETVKSICPDIKVGLTMSLYDYQALPGGEKYVKNLWNEDLLHYLPYMKDDDFIGIQNYTRKVFGPEGKVEPDKNAKMTAAGNEYYPQSLAGALRFVSNHWDKEIVITEHGISTEHDEDRVELIKQAMEGVYECVEEGMNITGYMHWSLLDNFEWQKGYEQKFGLVAVDRTTQTRIPKESLTVLGSIRKSGL